MTTPSLTPHTGASAPFSAAAGAPLLQGKHLLILALLTVLYAQAFREMQIVWSMAETYYSHGYLVPVVSAFFLWRNRASITAAERTPTAVGYVLVGVASLLLLGGDFFGFRVFGQLSLIPMLFGVSLVLWGAGCTAAMWFPIVFLVFMVPIPPSLTQSVALQLKLTATECAVTVANWLTLPVVREGSFIHFQNDRLLIGEVCGGLRSLIALLAFGSLMAYLSKTQPWARLTVLAVSVPIAIAANVTRILLLCVVGFYWGSDVAAGWFHDVSGILIFVVAFILFFALESVLRRAAPLTSEKGAQP